MARIPNEWLWEKLDTNTENGLLELSILTARALGWTLKESKDPDRYAWHLSLFDHKNELRNSFAVCQPPPINMGYWWISLTKRRVVTNYATDDANALLALANYCPQVETQRCISTGGANNYKITAWHKRMNLIIHAPTWAIAACETIISYYRIKRDWIDHDWFV